MILKVVSLPLRIGLSATRTTLRLSTKLAVFAAGEAIHVVESRFVSPTPPPSSNPNGVSSAEPSETPRDTA